MASLSMAFCVLLLILSILELYWIYTIVAILTIVISFLIYRYSKFLAEKFYHLNKLALFLPISILAVILTPFITKPLYGTGALLYLNTVLFIIGVTSILISSSLTYLGTKLKNQFISWPLSIFLGLCSPFIFVLLSSLAFRQITGSGHGSMGFALILFFCIIVITIISIIVNIYIKMNSTKITDRETLNFAILVITGIIFLISEILVLKLY